MINDEMQQCPFCNAHMIKNGHYKSGKQRYICSNKRNGLCCEIEENNANIEQNENIYKCNKKFPKVLIFDLEIAPLYAWIWRTYKQVVFPNQLESDWFCLSWAAKWLNDPKIYSQVNTPKAIKNEDDSKIIKPLWDLINEADIIIAHNAMRYDRKRMNTRFLLNKLPPPLPYQTIDTLITAKSQFAFSDNSLNGICKVLDLPAKTKIEKDVWVESMKGNTEALKEMGEYNINDVLILEDVYMKLRPWVKSHPNLSVYVETEGSVCPVCLNKNLNWGGYYATTVSKFRSFRCDIEQGGCGAIGRHRTSVLSKTKRKSLVVSVAR